MTDFKIDDLVVFTFKKSSVVEKIRSIDGQLIRLYSQRPESSAYYVEKHLAHACLNLPHNYELVPTKPVYQRPPHKHCAMICHVANGGVVRNVTLNYTIEHPSKSFWSENEVFEIVQSKTEDELRIDNLQYCIKVSEDNINRYKREIEDLKPTVHY